MRKPWNGRTRRSLCQRCLRGLAAVVIIVDGQVYLRGNGAGNETTSRIVVGDGRGRMRVAPEMGEPGVEAEIVLLAEGHRTSWA